MLHDPSHHTSPPVAAEIKLSGKDTEILRRLAGEVAQIGHVEVTVEYADDIVPLDDLGQAGRVDDVFLITPKDDLARWMVEGEESIHVG